MSYRVGCFIVSYVIHIKSMVQCKEFGTNFMYDHIFLLFSHRLQVDKIYFPHFEEMDAEENDMEIGMTFLFYVSLCSICLYIVIVLENRFI